MSRIKTTPGQEKKLMKQHPGTGLIFWKSSDNSITQCEFFIKDGALFGIATGKRLTLSFDPSED
jgi:hypothetical protein